MNTVLIAIVVFLVCVGVVWVVLRMRKESPSVVVGQTIVDEPSSSETTAICPDPLVTDEGPEPLSQIILASGGQEVLSITVMDDSVGTSLDRDRLVKIPLKAIAGTLGRLSEPLAQAAPSLLVATAANSSKLMEVTINGQLLAAADGNGLRAIAKSGKGFEHARLYEPSNLQNLANAAAIWQIASIVVAQKHLADISATLKRVESKVDGVQSFLEESRSAVIHSTMDYLGSAKSAIEQGEFLERTRLQMELFDTELNRVGKTLVSQIERQLEMELEKDNFGCEGEYTSGLEKHRKLGVLVDELLLCNEVRLANWYLCSVYPDNSTLLQERLIQINKEVSIADKIKAKTKKSGSRDINSIDAKLTSDETIAKRRGEVKAVVDTNLRSFTESLKRQHQVTLMIEKVSADLYGTSRLLLETRDGVPVAAYLADE